MFWKDCFEFCFQRLTLLSNFQQHLYSSVSEVKGRVESLIKQGREFTRNLEQQEDAPTRVFKEYMDEDITLLKGRFNSLGRGSYSFL